jgi:hypothetical protein
MNDGTRPTTPTRKRQEAQLRRTPHNPTDEFSAAGYAAKRPATPDHQHQAKKPALRPTPTKITNIKATNNKIGTHMTLEATTSKKIPSLTNQQSKYKQCNFRGLMAPSGPALDHPAAPLLLELATLGCSSAMGDTWTIDLIEAAIQKGAHPSVLDPEAAAQLREETLEKVNQGYARLVFWDNIKHNPPANLKISPIAAIPHKSRKWRMILDLSHGVAINNKRHPSVNESTNPTIGPKEAMAELGNVLPRLIYAVATAPDVGGPILFSKIDIKDGYWRMVVPEDEEWHFAYVLPKSHPDEPLQLVVPSCLQMGWCDSPAFFCAASETARDVTQDLATTPVGSLPPHPLENWLLHPAEWPDATLDEYAQKFVHLIEVYVDDFIQLAQTTDPAQLEHLARAILHGIHSVFPPPAVTGHAGEDPVALKKLKQGDGLWTTRKELLGWIFDGARRCIELPPDKIERLISETHAMHRTGRVRRKDFEKLRGRLRHACIGIPAGKGLMGPIDGALRGNHSWIEIRRNPALKEALGDFGTIMRILGQRPTNCKELIVTLPGFLGYCDASKMGAGGVWQSGTLRLAPIVWRVEWPPDIRDRVVSFDNPGGTITNSDLEMGAMLIHYLVLEHVVSLKHVHVAAWCDNTPTVSWTNKLSSSRSRVASRLVRALAMRIHVNEASPLISVSIAGTDNKMADMASRTFSRHSAQQDTFDTSDSDFLHLFSATFPLQTDSWRVFRLSNKLISKVCSELRGEASTLGSWRRITAKGSAIGAIGGSSSNPSLVWTPCLPRCQQMNKSNSLAHSLSGSGMATMAKELASELLPYKSRYLPSERALKWTAGQILPTVARASIGSNSNDKLKGTNARTPQPNTSSPSP